MYIKNGVYRPHKTQSSYDLYGAYTLTSIFTTNTIGSKIVKSVSAPKGKLRLQYGKESNAALARTIYFTYMMLMLDDVVDGNIVKFGFRKDSPTIHVGYLKGPIFNRIVRKGYYIDEIDLKKYNYGIPAIFLSSKILGNKVVRLPKPLKDKFLNKLKAGFSYPKVKVYETNFK